MAVESTKRGRVVLVRPLGRWLDQRGALDLQRAIEGELTRGERYLVLDLSDVAYVDSSGFGSLVRLLELIPPGGRLVLCRCGPPLLQLLQKARLDRVLLTYPTETAAIASLAGAAAG